MKFHADLHIHSKYSRACSRDCDLEHLAWWAARKGVRVVGTGDFTHPGWIEELRTELVPAEPGLFRLRPERETEVMDRLPASCQSPVRFLLSSEISTIYKRDGRTRKVHHLLYAPDFDSVAEITRQLDRIGNLASDGRPILGLDSRDLLEITLGSGDDCYLVPAHVWTPWFAALGSQSGFDAIEDCYADLSDHVFALETGLSSDPEMNWRVSSLDRYRLVSNSDAHSPPMLAREATVFDTEPDYFSILKALRTGDGFGGTVEFFPEEGKYHLDGHRACDVRTAPLETRGLEGRCPECGKALTVGVLHRIETLADRPQGYRPEHVDKFRSMVPLPEVIGEIVGFGPKSKAVSERVANLVGRLGSELAILDEIPLDDIKRAGGSSLLVEALTRLRRGEVYREAGYDGVYGTIRLFTPEELATSKGAAVLFDLPMPPASPPTTIEVPPGPSATPISNASVPTQLVNDKRPGNTTIASALLTGLDEDQRAVVETAGGPLLVVAGPGTGKTRVLTHLIAHRVRDLGVDPENWLAMTFTRRASAEFRERLSLLLAEVAQRVLVTTFHGLGLLMVREQAQRLGLPAVIRVADDAARLEALRQFQPASMAVARKLAVRIGNAKRRRVSALWDSASPDLVLDECQVDELVDAYDGELHRNGLVDLEDLITLPVALLEHVPEVAERYRRRWPEIAVDEYQDIDELQYRFLRLLSGRNSNLSVIGDPDQAIYGFRGGDVGYFLRFRKDYPTAQISQLTSNYRSTPTIVQSALQVIKPVTLVKDRRLTSVGAFTFDEPIVVHHAGDEEDEAEIVADMIEQLLGGTSFLTPDKMERAPRHQLSFSDFAVLYRTQAQAVPVAECLRRRGFPVQVRSHERLADRPEVQAVLTTLTGWPREPRMSLSNRVNAAIKTLGEKDNPRLMEAAELLHRLARECGEDFERFCVELALGVEVDLWDPRADRVSLLTLHASKGLEFAVVFVVGCEEGMVPFKRWMNTPDDEASSTDDPAEERRLFYVGMTRATTQLVLTTARRRSRWGTATNSSPSRFLADIDPEFLKERHGTSSGRTRGPAPHRQLRLL